MSWKRRWGWILGSVGGAVGLAAAGTAVSVVRQRARRGLDAGAHVELGSLHSTPRTVVAEDGVPLHVEVDEADEIEIDGRPHGVPATVVFAHGYCLNLDSWHFQRAAYRGLVRSVYYDQRSHGRSGRAPRDHSTIDQLGRDLKQILDEVVPEGPIVLVGHSMGGMTIMSLAAQYPEMIGDRVIGVGLIATTAGGLDPAEILIPLLPPRFTGRATRSAVAALARGHRAVDTVRRVGKIIANSATHRFAFGSEVPREYVAFVDRMLHATPFEVVSDFFPQFGELDLWHSVTELSKIPVTVLCGTVDRLTAIGHSRKLAAAISGSRLVEYENAGHMVTIERHDQVNAELDQLITAATSNAAAG